MHPAHLYHVISNKRALHGSKPMDDDQMFHLMKDIDALFSEATDSEPETDEDIHKLVICVKETLRMMTH